MSETWEVRVIRRRGEDKASLAGSEPIRVPDGIPSGELWWESGDKVLTDPLDAAETVVAKLAVTAVRKIRARDV